MNWANRLILALMLLIVASPALAAIDRFTDDKGTLHITNSSKEKALPEERDEDTSSPPKHFPRRPAVMQPPPEAEPPPPAPVPAPEPAAEPAAEPVEREEPKPSSYLTVRKGVIHITNVSRRPVDLAKTQSASDPGPVSAAQPPAAPVMPVTLAQAAPTPATTSLQSMPTDAGVKSYRDKQGVIHINNAPARPFKGDIMVAGWSAPGSARFSRQVSPASQAARVAPAGEMVPREALPISQASLGEFGHLALLPVRPAAVSSAPVNTVQATKAKVRRFRDGKGTIHIVGKGAAPAGALPPAGDRMAGKAGLPPVSGVLDPTLPPTLNWAEPTVALRRDGQGRLVIRNAPRGETPKGDKEEMHRRLSPVMVEAAYLYGLPVSLIEAVIKVESNFHPGAMSPKGAMGLMQLMPGTAKFLGVDDAFSPRQNILGGTRYLRLLLNFFGQSLPLALAAYNAGFQRVIDAGFQVPNIKETQDFVAKVLGHYHFREKQRLAQRLLL